MQYTIRNISPKVDKALRDKARKSGKSLNEVARAALAREAGVSEEPRVYDDLDWFIGSGTYGKEWDEAMEWLDNLPNDLDK